MEFMDKDYSRVNLGVLKELLNGKRVWCDIDGCVVDIIRKWMLNALQDERVVKNIKNYDVLTNLREYKNNNNDPQYLDNIIDGFWREDSFHQIDYLKCDLETDKIYRTYYYDVINFYDDLKLSNLGEMLLENYSSFKYLNFISHSNRKAKHIESKKNKILNYFINSKCFIEYYPDKLKSAAINRENAGIDVFIDDSYLNCIDVINNTDVKYIVIPEYGHNKCMIKEVVNAIKESGKKIELIYLINNERKQKD
jgi:hypothetical protein